MSTSHLIVFSSSRTDHYCSTDSNQNTKHDPLLLSSIGIVVVVFWLFGTVAQAQLPTCLINSGQTLYRVNAANSGVVEVFPGLQDEIIAMAVVPTGVNVTGCEPGDILAFEDKLGGKIWSISPHRGVLELVQVGNLPEGIRVSSIAFAHDRLFGISATSANFREFDPITFGQVGVPVDLQSNGVKIGGMAFDGISTWYLANSGSDKLIRLADPPTSSGWDAIGETGVDFAGHGLEIFNGELWGGLLSVEESTDRVLVGRFNVGTASFQEIWEVDGMPLSGNMGFAAFRSCISADGDGDADGDVDRDDYTVFVDCLEGPAESLGFPGCLCLDLDNDGNVDIRDYANLQILIGDARHE